MLYCIQKLNDLYKNNPALYELQFSQEGFEWVNLNKSTKPIFSYLRKGKNKKDTLLIVLNFTNQNINNWEIEVGLKQKWTEIFNSSNKEFWGDNHQLTNEIQCIRKNKLLKTAILQVNLPALSALVLR